MSKETFRAAKLAALKKYKEKAKSDMETAKTKRQLNNATRRYNLCIKKEKEYDTNFWTADMEYTFRLFKDSDDISSVAAM
jgi:hypothetical protein